MDDRFKVGYSLDASSRLIDQMSADELRADADAHFVGLVKLANPYGEGNHHRMSWRRAWDVDGQAMTARHRDSGFVMVFSPCPQGGYTATVGAELPPFGPDGELAMAQMFGLRQLLKDGWDIWHTVVAKKRC